MTEAEQDLSFTFMVAISVANTDFGYVMVAIIESEPDSYSLTSMEVLVNMNELQRVINIVVAELWSLFEPLEDIMDCYLLPSLDLVQ